MRSGPNWSEPPAELVGVLLPAYLPCPGFAGACNGLIHMWNPAANHVPRGFCGATGKLEDVKLVLVCAEPSPPYAGHGRSVAGAPALDDLRRVYTNSCAYLRSSRDKFFENLRLILDLAWPRLSFDQQMRRTWITETVLCSAFNTTGPIAAQVEKECGARYLQAQLSLLPDARVVALGGKAQRRLRQIGFMRFLPASAAAPPEGNKPRARQSWAVALAGLDES